MASGLIRDKIAQLVEDGINVLRNEGVVKLETTPDIMIERPSNRDHGDFATNLPLRLSRSTSLKPMELAQRLVDNIPVVEELSLIHI